MINLVGIHLGGSEAPIEGGGGGSTPTPTPLPSAGRPYVDKKDFQFDPVTHVVTLRARVADAGEVKNPEGEAQAFPIPVPEPPALPDAGKPYVERFEFDEATRRVTLQARVSKAGEVKEPEGEVQTFNISVPEPITGVVYEYMVDNMTAMPQYVSADTGTPPPGEQMGATEATLPPADPAYGTVFLYSYVKPFPDGIQLSLRPLTVSPGKASYLTENLVVLGSNLVITRQVSITD